MAMIYITDREPDTIDAGLVLHALTTTTDLDDDGIPMLTVSDGATTIHLVCGLRGPGPDAIAGLLRLADAARHLAGALAAARLPGR